MVVLIVWLSISHQRLETWDYQDFLSEISISLILPNVLRYTNLQECLWLLPREEDSELKLCSEGSRTRYIVDRSLWCSTPHCLSKPLIELQLHQSCPKQRIPWPYSFSLKGRQLWEENALFSKGVNLSNFLLFLYTCLLHLEFCLLEFILVFSLYFTFQPQFSLTPLHPLSLFEMVVTALTCAVPGLYVSREQRNGWREEGGRKENRGQQEGWGEEGKQGHCNCYDIDLLRICIVIVVSKTYKLCHKILHILNSILVY